MSEPLSNIKTNIITGFLGAGKSTAILNLFKQKPESERWAVLVNEFGEVGIDGGLLAGHADAGIFIREVPGGCMCCAAGLPMQIAMNMLLTKARPDRLIIEPTGLGHPAEVMSVLAADYYQELLDLRATITMVDARKIADTRYTQHDTFNQQLEIADVILASKSDLYAKDEYSCLENYLSEKNLFAERTLQSSENGSLDLKLLDQPAKAWQLKPRAFPDISINEESTKSEQESEQETVFPPEGFIRLSNSGEGFESYGWLFHPSSKFDHQQLAELFGQTFSQTRIDRLKAIVKTNAGSIGFNYAGDILNELHLKELDDSRIELISSVGFDVETFEADLLETRLA